MESRRKMSTEWLESFHALLGALEVLLEMTTPVQSIAERGTFEVHLNHLGGNLILATVAHSSDILGSHQSLVESLL
jgi:hypothetical protein